MAATIAVATIGPIPGICRMRVHPGSAAETQTRFGTGVRTSQRRAADSGKESVRPKGGGCFERGTLNADRKANRKGAALFDGLTSWRE
jgi:hypothetical protein